MEAPNQLLQLKLQVAELSHKVAGHRKQHNDDHYRSDTRKRANRPKEPKEHKFTSYKNLVTWLRDCEDYISTASSDFTSDKDKLTWAASFLSKKVLLRSINFSTLRPKKKLEDRQLGPFVIEEQIGTQVYRLDLSAKYGAIHSVFYVFLLEPWHARDDDSKPQPVFVDDEEE